MQRQHPPNVSTARRQVHMKRFNRLVTMHYANTTFLDDLTELRSKAEIDGQSAV